MKKAKVELSYGLLKCTEALGVTFKNVLNLAISVFPGPITYYGGHKNG